MLQSTTMAMYMYMCVHVLKFFNNQLGLNEDQKLDLTIFTDCPAKCTLQAMSTPNSDKMPIR